MTKFCYRICIVVSWAVTRTGPVDGLSKITCRTLLDTPPSGVISEVTQTTLIHTSRCGIVSVLISTAVEHTFRIEDVTIGELSSRRAG